MLACGAVPIRGRDGNLRLDLGLLAAVANTGDVQGTWKLFVSDLVSQTVCLGPMGQPESPIPPPEVGPGARVHDDAHTTIRKISASQKVWGVSRRGRGIATART